MKRSAAWKKEADDRLAVLRIQHLHIVDGSLTIQFWSSGELTGTQTENVMKHVSKYGKENTRETFAEALSCEDGTNAICNEIKKSPKKF